MRPGAAGGGLGPRTGAERATDGEGRSGYGDRPSGCAVGVGAQPLKLGVVGGIDRGESRVDPPAGGVAAVGRGEVPDAVAARSALSAAWVLASSSRRVSRLRVAGDEGAALRKVKSRGVVFRG